MFFSLKPDCYFRHYGKIGHIVRPILSMEEVVDECGALFIEQLEYEPEEIDTIVKKLEQHFSNVRFDDLKKDAIAFYSELAQNGFLNMSESLQEFKNEGFNYKTLEGKLADNHIASQLEEPSSYFLGEYFKEKPFLETFHIELTSKCNERCVHCYIPHKNKTTDINESLMLNTLKQCKELGVLTVIFSGGEPMLHPQFCKFLKYAKDLDINVTVLSNLTLLTDDIIEALKYRHIACVNVSLYSMDPAVHDSITTIQGSFEKTKNNILRLIENNIAVQINCPVIKQNKDSFYEVIKWGQDHKCSVVTDYLIMARFDRSTDNLDNRLSTDELNDVIQHLIDNDVIFKENFKNRTLHPEMFKRPGQPDDKVCGVGMSTMCMVANGNVYPCAGWQQYVCGNLNDTSLSEIWSNSPAINYLRKLRLKDFKQCVGCKDFDYCVMCMSRNSNEDPDGNLFNIPEITCKAAQIHHRLVESYKERLCGD